MLQKSWLAFSVIFLLVALSSFRSSSGSAVHPYHVGSVEFSYNANSHTFEITAKFFLDDLENALKKKYGRTVYFSEEKHHAQMNELLNQYSQEYLKLKIDNKFVAVNYLGFEEDRESVNIYLESQAVQNPKKIETAVSFLYNLFDDQMNIIHLVLNGRRHSERLNYPNRYLHKTF